MKTLLVPAFISSGKRELEIFEQARRYLPSTVFDKDRWKAVVGPEWWPHVVYVLNRGGRFQAYHQAYKDRQLTNKYGKLVGIYFDKMVTSKNSMTGKPYLGHADFIEGPRDCMGRLIEDESAGYDMTLITYKTITETKSRTASNYWLRAVRPENLIEISPFDAERIKVKEGDRVKLVSASNEEGVWDLGYSGKKPMIGRVHVIQGIRPGVVAFSLGHGHWSYGANDVTVDGVRIPSDSRRAKGVHGNAAMRVDPVLKNTGLVDPVGGSAVFYQRQVKLVRM